jgi:hypothetical protein
MEYEVAHSYAGERGEMTQDCWVTAGDVWDAAGIEARRERMEPRPAQCFLYIAAREFLSFEAVEISCS